VAAERSLGDQMVCHHHAQNSRLRQFVRNMSSFRYPLGA